MGHDVLAFGEALLRIQPQGDQRIEDASSFAAYPGGAELNTCAALASLGLSVAWYSALPEGPLGRRILRHLRSYGVDVSLCKTAPGRLGSYWVEYGREPRTIEVLYDRKDSTICHVRREDAPWDALAKSRAFFVSGITPALGPGPRELTLEMVETARAKNVLVAIDLNYRARLWSPSEAAPVLEQLARMADLVIAAEDDLRVLYGIAGEAEEMARAAQERFRSKTVVLTRGSEGGLCLEDGEVRHCSIFASTRIDRIGAGDAFSAGFLYARLTDRKERALDYALAMAAIKHSLHGDSLITTPEEVERVMERETRDIRR
jgi:2-dehydro-3-deoxygluconokinase